MSFFEELKRRNVFRVGIAYAVATWLLVQVTDIVFPRIGLPDSAVTLVIALLAIGFIPALIFAWAFEMTPDGVKKAADIDRSQSITPKTGRKLDRLIIAALVLVIFSMAAERFWFDGKGSGSISPQTAQTDDQPDTEKLNLTPGPEQESVAVLPFTAMSTGEDDGYFADGLTEEILNALTALPELLVTARTSSFYFKGRDLPIPEIAATLGVNHVVEGSVRRSGDRVRITAQLIRAEDGFHLWSNTYDRTLNDVFAVQEDIASNIAQTLDVVLNDDKREKMKRAGIGNVEAFIAYQKGLEMMERALFSDDWSGIAAKLDRAFQTNECYMVNWVTTLAGIFGWATQISDHYERLMRCDPLSGINVAMGGQYLLWAGQAQKTIDINSRYLNTTGFYPWVDDIRFMAALATRTGDLENAMKYELRAAELDPLGTVQLTDLANVYLLNGDYEQVISLARRALALDPMFFSVHRHLAGAYFFLGDVEQLAGVARMIETLPNVPSDIPADITIKLSIAVGELDEAHATVKRRAQLAKSGQTPAANVAYEAAQLGDFDTAGELLLQAYEEKDGTWIFPTFIRLPEQAPDSEPWQEFWRQPGVAELAELRRSYGFSPQAPVFGEGAKQ